MTGDILRKYPFEENPGYLLLYSTKRSSKALLKKDTYDSILNETLFVYLIRRDGRLEVETDVHCQGLFEQEVWIRLLRDTGFEVKTAESGSGKYLGYICTR